MMWSRLQSLVGRGKVKTPCRGNRKGKPLADRHLWLLRKGKVQKRCDRQVTLAGVLNEQLWRLPAWFLAFLLVLLAIGLPGNGLVRWLFERIAGK